jgi:hypothetical protein
MRDYYIYSYIREDGSPYYIGKGKGTRAWKHAKRDRVKTPTDLSKITVLNESLTEDEAFQMEIELIAKYGRKDLGTGILINATDGGDGASGRVLSEGSLEKIANSVKNIEKVKCEHCGIESAPGNYSRWHGDNCLSNPNFDESNNDRLYGDKHPQTGKSPTTESIEKNRQSNIRSARYGKSNPMFKGWYKSPSGDLYATATEAALAFGVTRSAVAKWVKLGKNGWSITSELL